MLEATIEVRCTAARAWQLLADIAATPAWVPGIADARVIEGDSVRPAVVQFTSMPSTGSLDYRLRYTYDDDTRTLGWSPAVVDDARGLEGVARIEAIADDRCLLHYQLRTWAGRTVPRWAQAALADDTAQRTVAAFRRWAETR
ncbi:MAG: SRPBCC family protein [Myxococcales bacterium]|nr:SRPBCC family protein [Myxococcales bacterium]